MNTKEIKLPPFPEGLCLREDIEDYARANVAHATAPLQAEIEALRAEVELWRHKAAVHQYRRKRLAEALKEIRSRSSMNLAMNPNPFELTARLGDIHQIADAALANETKA